MVLYTGTADVGARVAVASGATFSAVPAAAGTFTVRAYAAATGGTPLAESAAITVAAAGAAKIGPDLVMTSATYAAGQNGQALSGGSGLSSALTLASGSRTLKFRVFIPTSGHDMTLVQFNSGSTAIVLANGTIGGSFIGNNVTAALASGWHDIRIEQDTVANPGYGQTRIYADGTSIYTWGSFVAQAANPTITTAVAQGVLLDELTIHSGIDTTAIPANGYPAGTANLVGDWAFDGNGLSR